MTDRELLGLAAKAAGITAQYSNNFGDFSIGEPYSADERCWNPLDDDGDALRLAVALYLDVLYYRGFEEVIVQGEGTPDTPTTLGELLEVREPFGGDIASSTRRAIVRAAAEIGRRIP